MNKIINPDKERPEDKLRLEAYNSDVKIPCLETTFDL